MLWKVGREVHFVIYYHISSDIKNKQSYVSNFVYLINDHFKHAAMHNTAIRYLKSDKPWFIADVGEKKWPRIIGICEKIEVRYIVVYCNYSTNLQALNPEVTVKQGQNVELTCEVKVDGVMKDDIKWYKDGEEITKGISKDR